jgi:nicotinate-nucleotide--dimethylbenzimidazole phosphoribosyltransferase
MTHRPEFTIAEISQGIAGLDPAWFKRARAHLDSLTKPLGSLGRLEEIAARMVAIREQEVAGPLNKAAYVFAADHGITAEGVSAYPGEVTHQMVLNFLSNGAAINVLARLHGAELIVVDVGVVADFADMPGMLHRKVRPGTRNMLHEPAITEEELARSLQVGLDIAAAAHREGRALIAVGEMGIGNTTAASAITAALTERPVAAVTGKGAGLDAPRQAHKVRVLESIMEKHFGGGPTDVRATPLQILQRVGGLEISAMTGMVLGAAAHRIAVVADGFISTSAAALAYAIAPSVRDYLFAGHRSDEPGHRFLHEYIGLEPILSLDMRLGEGTGAVLAMPIIESAVRLYEEMATFASSGVSVAKA